MEIDMRQFERDSQVEQGLWMVARLDGKGFSRKTLNWGMEKPFDIRFRDIMTDMTEFLMKESGFDFTFAFTQSDEISLLFRYNSDIFNRRLSKICSVLSGLASSFATLKFQDICVFDCRISQLPSSDFVNNYFSWRQDDGFRNAVNGYAYWNLIKNGYTPAKATSFLEGINVHDKISILNNYGIHFEDVPLWQKHGISLYFGTVNHTGFNPMTQQNVETTRRVIVRDYAPSLFINSHFVEHFVV